MRRSFLVFAFLALGCDSTGGTGGSGGATSSSTTGGPTTTTGTTTSTGPTTTSSTGSGMTCDGPGFGGGEVAVPGGAVTATIVDAASAPVPNLPLFICGIDLCSPAGMTGANGGVSLSTTMMMKRPAFKFGDAVTYPEFAIVLTEPSTAFGTLTTAKLPATGQPMVAGAEATSGGVTLSIAAGASVEIDTLLYDTPDKQAFRAVPVPPAGAQVILADAPAGLELLYGVSPAESVICPAAGVRIPNTPAWPANTAVEFFEMTVDPAQTFAQYGGWTKVSDGAVTADGVSIETTQGLVLLQNFAVRKKP